MPCTKFSRNIVPFVINKCSKWSLNTVATSQPTADEYVQINESKQYATIVINRPKVLNAINLEMLQKIDENLKKFEKSKTFVIIKGIRKQIFCSGGDITALRQTNLQDARNFMKKVYTLVYFIANKNVPNIALIDGITMGGGCGLAVHGKYCIATEHTVLAMPEAGIGLFPDVGSSYFFNRLKGKLGLYMGMTGSKLTGHDVLKVGLASHFCESDKLPDLECELMKCTDSNDVHKTIEGFSLSIPRDECMNLPIDKVNSNFKANNVEGIFENLKKHQSEWALTTLELLKEKCPLSLKLTFKQFELGENLPLDKCIQMEYRMAYRCVGDSNFHEGVRALLVDKDKKPAWKPPTIYEVPDEHIEKFFDKLPEGEELVLKTK